jgi:predicted small secreted protein
LRATQFWQVAHSADIAVGRKLTFRLGAGCYDPIAGWARGCPVKLFLSDSILAAAAASTRSKEIVMRKLFALFALAGVMLVTGCNTISGAGKDIERGGEKVQGAAQDTKQKM